MAWTPKPTQIKNKKQKTEVPKSYSVLLPHRKGEGAKGRDVPGVRRGAPSLWDIPPQIAALNGTSLGLRRLKTPHTPFIKTKEKQISLPPKPKYIYIFLLKKQKFEGIKR